MTGDQGDRDDDPDADTGDEYPIPPVDLEAMLGDDWDGDRGDQGPTPDTDPRHLDPAGDIADAVESGEFDIELADDQDVGDLREFLRRAEAGEFDADPGLEATVRIVRSLLDDVDQD